MAKIFESERTENLITTYMERDLHASLKAHFCPDSSFHEVKIGRFVADACVDGVIYEIQTGSFSPLAKKLRFYLENTDFRIVIVHPIAKNRRILWLEAESGELAKTPRKSSKHESIANGISNIYYLKEFLGNERISFCFAIMEIDEVRLLDGYGKQNKIRATSVDRIAGEIYSFEYINCLKDVENAVLPLLPDEKFGRDTLSKSLRLKGMKLWSAQKFLIESEILSCEKDGKRLIFDKKRADK